MNYYHKNIFFVTNEWQWPAITEKHALKKVLQFSDQFNDQIYIGFPWATLFDYLKQNKKTKANYLLNALEEIKKKIKNNSKKKILTVCQHIHMLKYIYLMEDLGITDIFWSHSTINLDKKKHKSKIHPFPLFPVKYVNFKKNLNLGRTSKSYLASFIGASSNKLYLSNIRNLLQKKFYQSDNILIKIKSEWHFQDLVYNKQIFENSAKFNKEDQKELEKDEYIEVMNNSYFSFCPSGTGPNSIRLWESICFGSIPIILSDNLELPGNIEIWKQACIFIGEQENNLEKLEEKLNSVVSNIDNLNNMRLHLKKLHLYYGPHLFIKDLLLELN